MKVEKDTIGGILRYGPVPVALATMGYKHRALPHDKILASMAEPNFLLKIIPHVDGTTRICELVRYYCEDVTVKGAWEGPAALELFHHALAPVASLPVREVLSGGTHVLPTSHWGSAPSSTTILQAERSMKLQGKSAIVTGLRERHRQSLALSFAQRRSKRRHC